MEFSENLSGELEGEMFRLMAFRTHGTDGSQERVCVFCLRYSASDLVPIEHYDDCLGLRMQKEMAE